MTMILGGIISDYATVTSTGIGAGKTNTANMIAKWNAEAYGTKNVDESYLDIWGVVENGWYVPSKDEWSAFASVFGIYEDDSYYSPIEYGNYWTSSLENEGLAWWCQISSSLMYEGYFISSGAQVRLGTNF